MAEVVVTGGQGFIGSHLTKTLYEAGLDVCSTFSYTLPREPARHRLGYFRLDATRFEDCLKLINQENPKFVFHLVAQPVVTAAVRHPFSTFELTVRGSYNLFEAIRQTGKPVSVICISSDKVYGDNMNAREDSPLAGVGHPYNTAKICEDIIAQSYAMSFGLPIYIVRSANIYGGGDLHWDRIVPGVCRDILEGRSPVLRSNGLQKRDYIYVDDLMAAYMKILEAAFSGKLRPGSPINLGADEFYTALEITDILLGTSGRVDLSPNILGGAKDEIPRQHIDYSFARERLGWSPKIDMREGLRRSWEWYKEWFRS